MGLVDPRAKQGSSEHRLLRQAPAAAACGIQEGGFPEHELASSIPLSQSVSSWFPVASGGPLLAFSRARHPAWGPHPGPCLPPKAQLAVWYNHVPLCFLGCPMCAPSLWAQLSSMQTSDSTDTTAAKTQFLQNLQTAVSLLGSQEPRGPLALNLAGLRSSPRKGWRGMARATSQTRSLVGAAGLGHREVFLTHVQSGGPQPRLSTEEVEAETGRLWKACSMLRLRMREELSAGAWSWACREECGGRVQGGFPDCHGLHLPLLTSAAPTDWMQEYRCLLTLEGLQAMVGQCLHRLQELRAGETPPSSCYLH
ncbi:hypothetical protein P7K49_022779 [Saguinus oedipus]|uniref:Uncharacterized protein n=1 Tax=Saguinus oedipus TaxID=9490 RepID=A0ABQ9ULA9_SAGOE|nr:hypothetical protein P7K49_022779 [Saguinus oedipus]